jgi:chromosome segregation protein
MTMAGVRLKAIRIAGFKSFPSPTVCELVPGITAIVGPNGAGKSNLVDAVLWAVGYPSARTLRGERMEDVLYAGGPQRPAAAVAEVTLVLEHETDAGPETLEITRRLYRNGESEFAVNQRTCRLRDVLAVCRDLHVMPHPYAVVPQGHILHLWEMRPPERRLFVEAVGGITAYKKKKEEIQKKIEETQQNLLRLYDILQEVEAQWSQARTQAERTRRYLDLQARITAIRRGLLAREAHALQAEGQQLEETLRRLRQKIEPLDRQYLDLQVRYQRQWSEAEELQRLRDRQRGVVQVAGRRLQEAERQWQAAQAEYQQAEQLYRQALHQQTQLEDQLQDLEQQIRVVRQRQEAAQAHQRALEAEHERLETEWAQFQESGRQLEHRWEDLRQRRAVLEAQREETRRQIAYWQVQARRLDDWADQREKRRAELNRQVQAVQEALQGMDASVAALEAEVADLQTQVQTRQVEVEALRQAVHEARVRLREAEQRVQSLRQSLEETEAALRTLDPGSPEAVDRALDRRGLRGQVLRVRDALRVRSEWTEAVARWGVGLLDAWLARDAVAAERLVEVFAECQAPSATVWIVEEVLSRPVADGPTWQAAFETDRLPAWVVEALGRLPIRTAGGVPWGISAEGAWIRLPGFIRWNASPVGEVDRFLRLRRLFEETERRLQSAQQEQAAVQQVWAEQSARLQAQEDELRAWVARYAECKAALDDLRRRREARLQELRDLQNQAVLIAQELEGFQRQRAEIQDRLTRLHRQVREQTARQEELDAALAEVESARQVQTAQATSLEAQRLRLQRLLGEAHQQVRRETEELQRLDRRRTQLQDRLSSLRSEVLQRHQRLAAAHARRDQSLQELQQARQARDQADSALQALEAQWRDAFQRLRQTEQALQDLDRERQRVLDEIRMAEIQRADWEARWKSFQERLAAVLPEVQPADLLAEVPPPAGDVRELQRLEDELAAMGPVNLMALQEYERLTERYRFLRSQQSDLRDGLERLQTALSRLDRQMLERLQVVLERLNESLSLHVRHLLNGYEARLVWLDPSDPLHSGVGLEVRHPRRRLRGLLQMSGGEKTLLGIALLLAANDLQPAAFVILDEADAPLDDANVDRFMQSLRACSDRTQFILVTHNKRTIQWVDALYGVFMDQGVSRLVSLRLEEAQTAIS